MSNQTSKRWWVSCAVAAATVVSLGAQTGSEPNVTILNSALHSFPPQHFVLVTVVETGAKTSSSEVRIELRDGADERRAFAKAVLMKGQPARLRFQVKGAGVQQFSTNLRITQLTNGAASQPFVTFEDLDVDTLRLETKPPSCYPPFGGGVAQESCPGWGITRLTLGDPGPPDAVDID